MCEKEAHFLKRHAPASLGLQTCASFPLHVLWYSLQETPAVLLVFLPNKDQLMPDSSSSSSSLSWCCVQPSNQPSTRRGWLTHNLFPAGYLRPAGRPCRNLQSGYCSSHPATSSPASSLGGWGGPNKMNGDWSAGDTKGTCTRNIPCSQVATSGIIPVKEMRSEWTCFSPPLEQVF